MVGYHPLLVILERCVAFHSGALEAHKVHQVITVGIVLIQAFLQRAVVLLDELGVKLRVLVGDLLELAKKLLHGCVADACHDPVLLQDLT